MAEANPVENLRGETTCPVCREYYTDPVTTLCGHNFCRPCITQYWGHLTANFPCPECRRISRKDTVHPNRLLANIVQIAKGFSLEDTLPQVEKECGKHREKLRLFCRTDQKSICVVCRDAREHRAHDVVPIDEAGEEYKEKLKNWLNPLKQEKKEIQEHQSNVEKRARTLKNQVERERRRTLAEFDRMYQILRNKEQVLLCRLEEMDVKIRVAREANMLKLSDEIALLDKLIVEMEEKASWPVEDFLQDVRSALKRCENVKFRKPEETRKNYKVFATMDPKTAHPQLVLSKDGRSVRCAVDPRQMQPRSLQRFTSTLCVVGCEEFTSGRHYWEMEVSGARGWSLGGDWRVGAARKSLKDMTIQPSPVRGIWAVERRREEGRCQALTSPVTPLALRETPKKIGIYLDFNEGRLSFYNINNNEHIYTFRDSFMRSIVPYYGLCSETELKLI